MTNQRNDDSSGRYAHLDAPTNMNFALDIRRHKAKGPGLGHPGRNVTINADARAAGIPREHQYVRGYNGRSKLEKDT